MKRVRLPDGRYAQFPDEMSNDDISSVLSKQFPAPQEQAPSQQPTGLVQAMQKPTYQEQGQAAAGMRSFLNEATFGLGRDVVAGLRAAPALFTEGKDFLPEYERQAAFEKAQLAGGAEQYPITSGLYGLTGGIAGSLALTPARVAGWLNKSAPFVERAAKYALVSAPVEAFRATQNLQEGETVPQAVERGLETAAIAGPLGATFEKGVGALTGAGRALVGGAKKGPITEAEKVIQAGKQANIPIRTTDVFPPQSWTGKRFQQASDRIPLFGTGGGLVKTQEARQKAVENFVRRYVPEAEANPAWLKGVTIQVQEKYGKEIKKFDNLKLRVLERPQYNTNPELSKQSSLLSKKSAQYQKDITKLEDELSGGQSRKYADLLQEEANPSYQASLLGVNIDNPEEFKYLLDGATQKMPSVKQPTTLLTRIRQLGGIKSTDYNKGDIKAMDINVRGKTKQFISSEGTLQITNKPKSLDYMREALEEEGWLPTNSTINDLLDLMSRDEMARNTGVGHIYNPKDASKGLEYENSFQYASAASEAQDKLYFDYGIKDPKAFKESIDKATAKAQKEFDRYQAKQGLTKTLTQEDANRISNEIASKNAALRNTQSQMDTIASQKISIPTPKLTEAIDKELASIQPNYETEMKTGPGQFSAMRKELLAMRAQAADNQGLNALENVRNTYSEKFKKDPNAFDFENKFYPALKEDMGNFLKSKSPVDYKKWQVGNQELQTIGGEARKTSLSSIINKGDIVPESAKNILLSKNASEVEILAKYLNNKGKQNARNAIVEDMMARSRIKGEENIDPDKFLEVLSQRKPQIKTFFSTQEQDAIKGLQRALRATKDAEKYAKSRPLLQSLLGSVPFVAPFTGTLGQAAAGVAAGTGLAGRAYQSKAVRNTLVALGRVKQNTTAEQRLIDKLISLQAGQATAREVTGEK